MRGHGTGPGDGEAGTVPGFAAALAHAVQEAGAGGLVHTSVHRTPLGVLLGLASAAPALTLAAVAVTRPRLLAAPGRPCPALPGVLEN
ncbi:hypothetical protein [Streptomyces massasporeus]|uniref:hypothetical protein n=1 Tax=Streptomyces massasporeus TaxID=67324 RepID=UPI00364E6A46